MKVRSIRDLAVAVRARRIDLGLSQLRVAERARVSRKWLTEFESGKPTAEFGLVLRLLDALGLSLNVSVGQDVDDEDPTKASPVNLDDYLLKLRDRADRVYQTNDPSRDG